ncbi:MAG: chromosome segregation protein SMC, partial [Culicoidibacterales bacterium]
ELVDLVKEHNQKIAYQVAALAKQSEGLQALQQEKVTVQATIAAEQVEIKALRIQTKGVSQQLRTTEIELNRVEVTLQTQLQQLSEVYHLTFEAADAKIGTQVLPTYARQEVFQLQKQLKKLGTVNLGAIEEFERLIERFTYLQTQSQDLETARDNLLTVIDEMDQEMNQRFQATFTQIQAAFADVFTQMFGGGTAQLVLTEAEYEDERGIELHVQPPGKKMQHLSLLSGGERALTAICLLFAIIRIRPVPFSILDEVEAALDEHNVSRFAKYVHRYSEETQFIVVTHRQGTMETADALYGVTMQQAGISTLVAVRLDEAKKMIQ